MTLTGLPALLALYRFSGGVALGTSAPFSGASPALCYSKKAGRGALGRAPGDLGRAEPRFNSRRGGPEAFRPNSRPSDARLVARGGALEAVDAEVADALRLGAPAGLSSRLGSGPMGMEPEVGRKGFSGRAEKWEPSSSPDGRRPPGRDKSERRAWVWLALDFHLGRLQVPFSSGTDQK